ncbi:MAG: hypothetical protein P1U63_03780 [Coxiellaceae bacterium]|nr:hypothetical protein [Coxiellaceae bacterium]
MSRDLTAPLLGDVELTSAVTDDARLVAEPVPSGTPLVISAYMPTKDHMVDKSIGAQVDMWIERLSHVIGANPWASSVTVVIPGSTEQAESLQSQFNASFGETERICKVAWGKTHHQSEVAKALLGRLNAAQKYVKESRRPGAADRAAYRDFYDHMQRLVSLLQRLQIVVMPIVKTTASKIATGSGWFCRRRAAFALTAATVEDVDASRIALNKSLDEGGIAVPILTEASEVDDAVDRIGCFSDGAPVDVKDVSAMVTIVNVTMGVLAEKYGHSVYAFADVPAWLAPAARGPLRK